MKQHQTPCAAKLGSVQSLTFGQKWLNTMDDSGGGAYYYEPWPR